MHARQLVLGLALLGLAACGPSDEEMAAARQEALRAARADSVAEAELIYDATNFDSISWAHPDSAIARGTVVFRVSCRRCHGADGTGGGELAVQHEIEMPDLTVVDWAYADNIDALHHRIFVGHDSEMPNWGLHGLKYRDIDAVARYLLDEFRP